MIHIDKADATNTRSHQGFGSPGANATNACNHHMACLQTRKTAFTVQLKNAGKLARIARPGLLEDLHPAAYFLKTWIA
jgi:hypothetical protein